MVLFAIMVPLLLLPVGAIVVDIGFWYRNAKTAQTTADAAALAGAAQIANDPATTSLGGQYVTLNMSDVTTSVADDVPNVGCPPVPSGSYCVEYPYIPDSGSDMGVPQVDEVEVTVTHGAPTFFGRLFGMFGVESTRRAVAEKFEIPGDLAIFSYQHPSCADGTGLLFNGKNAEINGLVHSNAAFQINGENFWAADGTIQRNNCTADVDDPPTSQFGDDPDATLPRDVFEPTHQPWPVWHTPGEFGWLTGCTYYGDKITINAVELKIEFEGPTATLPITDREIPTGTYCARQAFEISGDDLEGVFTAVAREIKVSGTGHHFAHFANRTLFFSVPNSDMDLSNDDITNYVCASPQFETSLNAHEYQWEGTIFNPCGKVKINGDDLSNLGGTIVAYQVEVNGDNFNMTGESEDPAVIELNLVE